MMTNPFRRLARNEDGVGFVEMAMLTPVLALMFLGMVDISKIVTANIDLEQAAQRTTDYALARRPTDGSTGYLVAQAVAASGRPADDVTVELTLECGGVERSSFTDICNAGETTHRYAFVAIEQEVVTGFNWRAMAAIFGGGDAGSGAYRPVTVTGDSLVRLQ